MWNMVQGSTDRYLSGPRFMRTPTEHAMRE